MDGYKQILINQVIEYDGPLTDKKVKRVLDELYDRAFDKKPKLLNTRQAAELTNMHPVTLRQLALKGVLKPIRYSARKIRWPEDMLLDYLYNGPEMTNQEARS